MMNSIVLNNGVRIPELGLGLFRAEEEKETINAIRYAYEAGYRLFDTASFYGNEEQVGKGLKELDAPREDYFVTTKIWMDDMESGDVRDAFERSLKKLQLDYIDLYLIHWPIREFYEETWRVMEKLCAEGQVRAIGVCNCPIRSLENLCRNFEIKPVLNQIECHPQYFEKEVIEYCKKEEIALEAFCPLGRGKYLNDPILQKIAEKYGKKESQVMLRWNLQQGIIPLPKSVKRERIISNADLFDFSLTEEEMREISSLNIGKRAIDMDPETIRL
ncbi:aldo/keto reductase [Lachnospiraceae bacterium 38-10]